MDNASKALIMVGAILIAVMLISLGVFLFTYARDTAEKQTRVIDATEIAAFNEQFLSFCGTDKSPATAKSAISTAKANKINLTGAYTTAGSINSQITYDITETYNSSTGYINAITINQHT